MASTIITKNSSTASATPAVGDLQQGELAVNVTDKKIYTKDSSAAIVKLVGSLGNQEASAVAITGGSIAGITDLAVADGGTGSSTAAGARSNLSAAASGANSDITSLSGLTTALSVAQGGTGVTSSTGSGSVVLSNSPTLVTPALGTPSAAVLTNATGLPLSTGISGLGTGVATFLGTPSSANLLAAVTDETGTGALVFANSPTLVTPTLGTPASATLTNATGLPIATGVSGLGTGVATALAVNVGSAGAPVVNGGVLGTPSSATLTNATGLPISTGVSGLGTGVATALAVNVGSAGAPVVNGGALGTPSSGTVTNLTGTASININGTVGATTPTTGAFTTTTVSTSETLSYGTANGVTYLNGSKVLTSGSALVFDSSDRLIVGGASAAIGQRLEVVGNTTGGAIGIRGRASDATGVISWHANAAATEYARIQSDNTSSLIFGTGASGTEQMRLTSTGLGIGTSSPSQKLSVVAGSGSSCYIETQSTGFTSVLFGQNNAGDAYVYNGYAGNIRFFTGAAEKMRLDSAGNLGLGVTPSAWGSNFTALQIKGKSAVYWDADGNTSIGSNIYRNSSNASVYYGTGLASQYVVGYDGTHKWFNAASGTAGNTISFTQAMTLDESGNLLVGRTSANNSFQGIQIGTTSSGKNLLITSSSSGNNGLIQFVGSDGSNSLQIGAGTGSIDFYGYRNAPMKFFTNGTEWMRITGDGLVNIGTGSATSSYWLTIAGDASGPGAGGIAVKCGGAGDANYFSTSTTIGYHFYGEGASSKIFRVSNDGNVQNSNNSYGGISDIKLKQDIIDASSQWSDLKNIRVRKYRFKNDPTGSLQIGLVAQEVEQISSGLVGSTADYEEVEVTDENGNVTTQRQPTGTNTKFVKYSVLYMKAIKALQEAMERIEQLEARLDAANL